MFLDDVYYLEYGGYYAHKLALGFQVISVSVEEPSPPDLYWSYEWLLHKNRTGTLDLKAFVRSVHLNILRYRPTFFRCLVKYLQASQRQEKLLEYVENLIVNGKPSSLISPVIMSKDDSRRWQEALFRFWREYERHKGNALSLWNLRTLQKIRASADGYFLVADYFGW